MSDKNVKDSQGLVSNFSLQVTATSLMVLGYDLVTNGNYQWGIALLLVGAGLFLLKYKLRGS